jgi:hypothetical protein
MTRATELLKVYKYHYDSFGDDLGDGELYSDKKKIQRRIKNLVDNYKWDKTKFTIEEINVN